LDDLALSLACSSLPARILSTSACQSSAGSAGCPVVRARWTPGRAGVAKIAAQQLDDIVNQLLLLRRVDIGQIIVRDVGRIAEWPDVRLAGVAMNAGSDDLLAVAHEFDFLAAAAIGGDQVDGDLGEWVIIGSLSVRDGTVEQFMQRAHTWSSFVKTPVQPEIRIRSGAGPNAFGCGGKKSKVLIAD
jgi:hypothetical protein